ncbi:MAG: peptide chain release factor 2 [Oscillospiraceae bacterium]|nr:peptide chain release factor 2 [Oscillospiraceae bacterium]
MLELDELKLQLDAMAPKVKEMYEACGIEKITGELATLEEKTTADGFWNDTENSKVVLKQISTIKGKISRYNALSEKFDDAQTILEIAIEGDDESLYPDAKQSYDELVSAYESLKLETLLSGEYDANNAILTLHAGAGGTEAQDWALMLYRMFCRWAERHSFKVKTLDMLDGDEAGIKSAVISIEGTNAYGFLKSESGVHRLVRVSPFDSSGRRHTSFASLEVMPEIEDDAEIEISDDDLKVDTYRSSGAGGQHVNKTESAIRITHIPTGIIVACQNERSQHQNREMAMKMLKSKLLEIKEREHLEKIEDIKGVQKEIAWGSQIRSYVFMPYTLAKDHRTGFEMGNIDAVMDGDIDGFINAYLKALSLGEIK